MFALIDCNNFYISCERVFNPRLEKKPVVVLSNNDGCIISRSNEAKKLSIPMGAPFYQWELFCKKNQVEVFSSNYELYGDMSRRVMNIIREFHEKTEIYSIDEAFLFFNKKIFFSDMLNLRNIIKSHTGIPISIGVGTTKTLAKIANQIAKNSVNENVFFLSEENNFYLTHFPIDKIWGIGHKLGEKLKKLKIDSAKKLREANPKMIRRYFSVSLEKTVNELNHIVCFELEENKPKKQIISSRSFGKLVTELNDLEEAISHYTHLATKKLRAQKGVASAIYVFLQTNLFNKTQPQYGNGIFYPLPMPTSNTGYLIRSAKKCLGEIYQKGFKYHKTGIMLLNISEEKIKQYDMLIKTFDLKNESLMALIDKINNTAGRDTIFFAAEGIKRDWQIKRDKKSNNYTTQWKELAIAFC